MKYILGLAVLSIWGLVVYRIYDRYFPDDDLPLIAEDYLGQNTEQTPRDSFVLAVNYKDPFLGRKVNRSKAIVSIPKNKSTSRRMSKRNKKKEITFPEIKYKGIVALKNDKEAAIVSINAQFINWRKGETYNGVNLLKIYQDSIHVALKGEKKTILKQQ